MTQADADASIEELGLNETRSVGSKYHAVQLTAMLTGSDSLAKFAGLLQKEFKDDLIILDARDRRTTS